MGMGVLAGARLQSVLAFPAVYRTFTRLVGGNSRSVYLATYVRPRPGDRILDIGCGPGDILKDLPAVDYLGLDSSAQYIEAARRQYGGRDRFLQARIQDAVLDNPGSYDLALATGVLHHLDDEEALALFRLARQALKPGGRLVTLDGCYEKGQSVVAALLLRLDRGKFVRTRSGYLTLASQVFPHVEAHIHHGLLRVPYTHVILECRA
jgi:SAM-dependent methyltransferase